MIVWALLAAALIAIAWIVRNDARSYARFKALTDTHERQRAIVRWAVSGILLWLVMPLVGLALLGRIDAIWLFPGEFAPVALIEDARLGMQIALLYVAGLILGALLGTGVRRLIKQKPSKPSRVPDITPMMPRNAAEARRVALLTLNAGISEEIFFRLYLPLLIVLAGGGPILAFAASALLFGALHRYQGVVGVIATAVLAAVFTFIYLLSLSLILPILLHLALNATNLLILPALRGWKTATDEMI